jgi:hypothetical protein
MLKGLISFTLTLFTLALFAQTGGSDKILTGVPNTAPNEDSLFDSIFISPRYLNPMPGYSVPKGSLYQGYLDQTSKELKDKAVPPFPVTYAEFRRQFLELKVEDPLANLRMVLPSPKEMRNLAYPEGGIVVQGPISFLYDRFSKEARSNRIYAGLVKKDVAYARYSYALITRITGLTDEDEIREFIDFCALQIQFILKASDYELYAAIMNCFSEYCKVETDTIDCRQ